MNRNKTPDLMVFHSNWGDRWNIPEGSKYNGEKGSKKGVGSERREWCNLKEGVQGVYQGGDIFEYRSEGGSGASHVDI